MKKIVGLLMLCFVLLGVTKFPRFQVIAVTALKPSGIALTPTPTTIPLSVIYVLPFPGILPTHPLYWFKTLRDSIIELLITDPVNKAEFYVLQADKKLNMGATLAGMGKSDEARRAFADALSSRIQAVTLLEAQVKSGVSVPGHLSEKLMLSLTKHKEVLLGVGEKTENVDALMARVQVLSVSL